MHEFEIIDLEQGTDEWLRWRNRGVGASDAPAIMGENPWKSIDDLWAEKTTPGFSTKPNSAMARGTALEPIAREAYCEFRTSKVYPMCVQSVSHSWMRCSIDGICIDNRYLVEIKCGESVYKKSLRPNGMPYYYYGQLQHILAVTGFESIDFWCYLPDKRPILTPVMRDNVYIEKLIQAEKWFWESIKHHIQ